MLLTVTSTPLFKLLIVVAYTIQFNKSADIDESLHDLYYRRKGERTKEERTFLTSLELHEIPLHEGIVGGAPPSAHVPPCYCWQVVVAITYERKKKKGEALI